MTDGQRGYEAKEETAGWWGLGGVSPARNFRPMSRVKEVKARGTGYRRIKD